MPPLHLTTAPPHCNSPLNATLMPGHRPAGPPAGHRAPCAILPGLDSPLSLVPPHHPQVLQPDIMPPVQYSLGWSAFVPFAFISDDGSQAEVAVGVHRYPLGGHAAGMLLRDQPLLDWRALLGDAMMRDVPDPLVEFQLFETGVSCASVWGEVCAAPVCKCGQLEARCSVQQGGADTNLSGTTIRLLLSITHTTPALHRPPLPTHTLQAAPPSRRPCAPSSSSSSSSVRRRPRWESSPWSRCWHRCRYRRCV